MLKHLTGRKIPAGWCDAVRHIRSKRPRPYPLTEQYENRLQPIEFYDRAGFRTYHMSEHHSSR
jgi:hypothetical protein